MKRIAIFALAALVGCSVETKNNDVSGYVTAKYYAPPTTGVDQWGPTKTNAACAVIIRTNKSQYIPINDCDLFQNAIIGQYITVPRESLLLFKFGAK